MYTQEKKLSCYSRKKQHTRIMKVFVLENKATGSKYLIQDCLLLTSACRKEEKVSIGDKFNSLSS